MYNILYITNIAVPYRTDFFNQLSKKVNLTVLYERSKSKNRNSNWITSKKIEFKYFFLDGIKLGNEASFSFRIIKYILGKYDAIIVGCFNSPVEMFAILFMKIFKIKYYINIDGEIFRPKNPFKRIIRNYFLKGAYGYFCAGVKSKQTLYSITKSKNITCYKFSSMSEKSIKLASKQRNIGTQDEILVVGQYEEYKGLDIAAQVARINPDLKFKFIGMNKKKEKFERYLRKNDIHNIKVIPFLTVAELQKEYINCKVLVLPSRQECWGLVVNEGAAFGIPIVSTTGSGAACDFLDGEYEQFLAKPNDVQDLSEKIKHVLSLSEQQRKQYAIYLQKKAIEYTIEENVESYIKGLGII